MKLIIPCFLLFSALTSLSQNRQIIYTDKAPKPVGPYSQAILSGNTLYVAGQIALKADGTLDSSTVENETTQVLNNIKFILEAAKMGVKNVVKSTIYVTDLKNFKRINDTYSAFFTEMPPARETVEVRSLPKGAHIEISVIAVK